MSSLNFIQVCKNNSPEILIDCLSRGVDVNTVSEDGRWSGLTIAADKNRPELLEIMLSHPDIKINNTTTYFGSQWTALMFACDAGNPTIVARLVQVSGLDVNYQEEEWGATAAHLASERGHTECVRILAETGRVDWNKRDIEGCTPLYWALRYGHSDIVDIIVQQPNIDYNVKTEDGETLAQVAVRGRNVKCLETLAAQETFDGDTPIIISNIL